LIISAKLGGVVTHNNTILTSYYLQRHVKKNGISVRKLHAVSNKKILVHSKMAMALTRNKEAA
jgi:hypothetical protein